MPALTRLGLYGGPRAAYVGFSAAGAVIALTGTITSATEADIVAGGKTLILTVANDTFVTTDGSKTGIIAGLDSGGAEATGWDAVVKAGLGVSDVAFSVGDTVCTITLPPFATYDISANETITATVPAASLTGGVETEAAPTFTVSYVPVADTASTGGWHRREDERETADQRKARVHAERVRLGIVEAPKPEKAPTKAVKTLSARQTAMLEAEQSRLIAQLEAMEAQDAQSKRVKAAMLLMLL